VLSVAATRPARARPTAWIRAEGGCNGRHSATSDCERRFIERGKRYWSPPKLPHLLPFAIDLLPLANNKSVVRKNCAIGPQAVPVRSMTRANAAWLLHFCFVP
jgi:hypothetical protein